MIHCYDTYKSHTPGVKERALNVQTALCLPLEEIMRNKVTAYLDGVNRSADDIFQKVQVIAPEGGDLPIFKSSVVSASPASNLQCLRCADDIHLFLSSLCKVRLHQGIEDDALDGSVCRNIAP